MGHITQIAAVENAMAIWEYDPDLPGNCVLGGSLDVIASIRTITIKVSAITFTEIICSLFHYYTLLDTGLWTMNWTFQKTTNSMQDYWPTQNPTP